METKSYIQKAQMIAQAQLESVKFRLGQKAFIWSPSRQPAREKLYILFFNHNTQLCYGHFLKVLPSCPEPQLFNLKCPCCSNQENVLQSITMPGEHPSSIRSVS